MKFRDIFFNEQAHNADLFSSGLAIFYPMVLMRQKTNCSSHKEKFCVH